MRRGARAGMKNLTCRQYMEAVRHAFYTTPTLEVFFVTDGVGRCNFELCGLWSPESKLAAYLPPQEGIVGPSGMSVAKDNQTAAATGCNTWRALTAVSLYR